jgi:beta-xylosidase
MAVARESAKRMASPGKLRLYSVQNITQNGNFWFVPNLLLQKFPMPEFTAATCIEFHQGIPGEHCGLVVMGDEWAFLSLSWEDGGFRIGMCQGSFQRCDDATTLMEQARVAEGKCYLRVEVNRNAICRFGYSTDGVTWEYLGKELKSRQGRWIGAKVGLFCINPNFQEGKAFADVDWFRISKWE